MKLSDPGVVALITSAGLVAAGAVAALANWLIRRQGRSTDSATVRKTEAETVAVEVKTARELLQEVKAYFTERLAEQAADHQRETAELNRKIDDLSSRVQTVEQQTQVTRATWAIHRAWDEAALAILRTTNPDYPAPPQVEL